MYKCIQTFKLPIKDSNDLAEIQKGSIWEYKGKINMFTRLDRIILVNDKKELIDISTDFLKAYFVRCYEHGI